MVSFGKILWKNVLSALAACERVWSGYTLSSRLTIQQNGIQCIVFMGLGVTNVAFGPSNISNGMEVDYGYSILISLSHSVMNFWLKRKRLHFHPHLHTKSRKSWEKNLRHSIVSGKSRKKIEIWYKHFHHGIKIGSQTLVALLLTFDGPLDFRSSVAAHRQQ